MYAVLQVYCLFIGAIAFVMLPQNIATFIGKRTKGAFLNVQFSFFTLVACAAIVGVIQIETTGIL